MINIFSSSNVNFYTILSHVLDSDSEIEFLFQNLTSSHHLKGYFQMLLKVKVKRDKVELYIFLLFCPLPITPMDVNNIDVLWTPIDTNHPSKHRFAPSTPPAITPTLPNAETCKIHGGPTVTFGHLVVDLCFGVCFMLCLQKCIEKVGGACHSLEQLSHTHLQQVGNQCLLISPTLASGRLFIIKTTSVFVSLLCFLCAQCLPALQLPVFQYSHPALCTSVAYCTALCSSESLLATLHQRQRELPCLHLRSL